MKEDEDLLAVDMHFHTRFSFDSFVPIKALIKRLKKKGIGIAITDHNAIRGALKLREEDVFSIPAIETTSAENIHTLHYFHDSGSLEEFYHRHIKPYKRKCSFLPLMELLDGSRELSSFNVMAHPFALGGSGFFSKSNQNKFTADFLLKYDGIEVFNSSLPKKNNLLANSMVFLERFGLTGGSDGHRLSELGMAMTCSYYHDSASDFIESIRRKESFIVGNENKGLRKFTAHTSKLQTPIRNPIYMARSHIKYIKRIAMNSKERLKSKFSKQRQKDL